MDAREYIAHQVAYFTASCRANPKLLGAEMEHFLIDKHTLRSYSYYEPEGQKDLVLKLIDHEGWQLILEEAGYPLGIEKNGSTITFEPGGQLEISLKPMDSVKGIECIYMAILEEIEKHLLPSQALVSVGYHPKTSISDLPLLPKKRYQMMFEYFKTHGAKSHNMMKGSAATQVSIDYKDEVDFIKKFRVAHFLAPILSSVFDATPIFEGNLYEGDHVRAAIWNETDPQRSKLVKGALGPKDQPFGFESYAKYLLDMPPVLVKKAGEDVFTADQPLKTLLETMSFDDAELEHIQTMVFPDARLKKYIEIRMADALPLPYNFAVFALVQTVFYKDHVLNAIYDWSLDFDDDWVMRTNRALARVPSEMDEAFYQIKGKLIDMVRGEASEEALLYLEPFMTVLSHYGSVSKWLKTLEGDAFLKAIDVSEYRKRKGL